MFAPPDQALCTVADLATAFDFPAVADAAGTAVQSAADAGPPAEFGASLQSETTTTTTSAGGESSGFVEWALDATEDAVRHATGWAGLAIIFAYSFLIAFLLPLPSEVVLIAPLSLGLPESVTLVIIMLFSGAGKALGSVFAFHIGQETKQSGPVTRWLERSRFDIVEWSERKTVSLVKKYGYVGLALALSVPGFPDTLSIYAFSVLGDNYAKFAAATFAGSVGRLLVTVGAVGAGLAIM